MTMVTGIEVDHDRAVVVKRAPAALSERLRLEGERLRRASHPGVVQVVRSAPAGGGWELRTAHAGRPLSIFRPLAPRQAAAIVAALASTLADLHLLGIVHGRVDATHVLVGERGRPLLCGFGDGTSTDRPEDDVAAIGVLLGELLGADTEPEPIPDRRWWGRRAWSGWDRRTLLLLADQACADPPTRRPTARRLAAAISEAVPVRAWDEVGAPEVASVPAVADLDPMERLRVSATADLDEAAPRLPRLVMATLGAAMLVGGALRFGGGVESDEAAPLADVEPTASTTVPETVTTTAPKGRPTVSTDPSVRTGVPIPDSILTIAGRRFRVGQVGDEMLLADWDCDGTATPALLRPATGEVYVFARWVERGEIAVAPAMLVPGADALVSEMTPSGCPTLAVRTAAGALVAVIQAAPR